MTTIAAIATPPGQGALGIIRLSGPEAFVIADKVWKGKSLSEAKSHTLHLGIVADEEGNEIDQAVASVFRAPNSFTGEDSIEFSFHGSPWILHQALNLLLRSGAHAAEPGEFTKRAFLNGRMDLASAEGVADLIASSSRAAHTLAIRQTRGAFSREFNSLRDSLVDLASLLELELDFSEEDVEFADRQRLRGIASSLIEKISRLVDSYSAGRAFKEGVPVVIAGVPNVGKSTLLNALLQDDKAIVSDIPGTTRDVIEDTCEIDGILYRLIDTAGLRDSEDVVENIGISRARSRIAAASVLLWLVDRTMPLHPQLEELKNVMAEIPSDATIIPVLTKTDLNSPDDLPLTSSDVDFYDTLRERLFEMLVAHPRKGVKGDEDSVGDTIPISAKENTGLDALKAALKKAVTSRYNPDSEIILTNARHYADLREAKESLQRALAQMEAGTSADIIAMDIRQAIASLTALTGAITTPDLLTSIFSRFCIGK